MEKYEGLVAKLVWDGADEVRLPSDMGQARADQLQGTAAERLSEIAGRVCYDSCGKGRSSADFHKHILEVGHLSVYEHFNLTVEFAEEIDPWIFLNRPGVHVLRFGYGARVTYNPRVILDWPWHHSNMGYGEETIVNTLRHHMHLAAPSIVRSGSSAIRKSSVVETRFREEEWISLFLGGSRGFSHEQVRHGDFTAISQRSTRYVDESGSPWVQHPLIQEFLASDASEILRDAVRVLCQGTIESAKYTYDRVVETLEKWLIGRGVDKISARKQSRGAGRGYLGNALYTEMIFSASVAQWKHMLRMRASNGADAEIRAIYIAALPELRKSRYGNSFEAFEIVPAGDGLGSCVKERS